MMVCSHCGAAWDEAHERGECGVAGATLRILNASKPRGQTLGKRCPRCHVDGHWLWGPGSTHCVCMICGGVAPEAKDPGPSVVGARSPRWALWTRMTIPCLDGLVYLVRLRIVRTPWFGVYVHDIHQPDASEDPHDHPWSFLSIVLRGHYVEDVFPYPSAIKEHPLAPPPVRRTRRHGRLSVHRMNTTAAHRIVEASPGLRTLILVGPRRNGWGFYTKNGFVPWQDYEHGDRGDAIGTGSSVKERR